MTKISQVCVNQTPCRPICLTLNKISLDDQSCMKLYKKNEEYFAAATANKKLYANKLVQDNSVYIGIKNKKKNTLRIFALDLATLKPEETKSDNVSVTFSPGCLAPLDMKTGMVYSVNCLVPQELIDSIDINPQVTLIEFTKNLLESKTITDEKKKLRFQKLVYYLNYCIEFANNMEEVNDNTVLCPHSKEVNEYFLKTFTWVSQNHTKANSMYYQKLYASILMLALILGDFKVDPEKVLDLLPIRKGMNLTKKGILQSFKFQSRGSYAIELKYPLRTIFTKLTYCSLSK